MKSATVLGMMSGTSLDGLDLALVHFEEGKPFTFLGGRTVPYSSKLRQQINDMFTASALDLSRFSVELADFWALEVRRFLASYEQQPDFIGSHGQTIFHQPQQAISVQIGNPAVLAARTGIPVVADFRAGNVAIQGQGAPLVPVAERDLFSEYDAWLNLGGIANITLKKPWKAWDICPCNQILNRIASKAGLDFDKDAVLSRKGKPLPVLLNQLSRLEYYQLSAPKSLGREYVDEVEWPILAELQASDADVCLTYVLHIAGQIADALPTTPGKVLVSGGGAFHPILMAALRNLSNWEIVVPEPDIIHYKEAISFAYLAWLRMQEKPNAAPEITGGKRAQSTGAVWLP